MGDDETVEFDYVIVGAGASSMGLLLGLLTKCSTNTPTFTVAVIERGGGGPHCAATRSIKDWPDAALTSSSSTNLLKMTIGNRLIEVPTGRGLGGTTNINAGLCTPPAALDFETWPEPWKSSMMSSVKSILNVMLDNEALAHHDTSVVSMLSIKTSNAAFRDCSVDSIWTEAIYPQFVTKLPFASKSDDGSFKRKNYYEALIQPLLKTNSTLSDCISWFTNTEAQRLLIKNECVFGVECYSNDKGFFNIYSKREVIVSAGVFESAALLLLSGLGRDEDLRKAGIIPLRKGSKMGVGRNLMDHPVIPKNIITPWISYSQSPNTVQALMQFSCGDDRFQVALVDSTCLHQIGPYIFATQFRRMFKSSILNQIMGVLFFVLRFVFRLVLTYGPLHYLLRHCTFGMNVKLMNPKSRGHVWLSRKLSSQSEPARRMDVVVNINSCYLTDDRDIEAIQKGWNICHEYCNDWLQQSIEVLPGRAIKDAYGNEWFRHFAHSFCLPYFHWCGTCSMKTEGYGDWVVNSHLQTRNVDGLRVCDASVFPSIITGPTALTCAALGFEFASILLNDSRKKNV